MKNLFFFKFQLILIFCCLKRTYGFLHGGAIAEIARQSRELVQKCVLHVWRQLDYLVNEESDQFSNHIRNTKRFFVLDCNTGTKKHVLNAFKTVLLVHTLKSS